MSAEPADTGAIGQTGPGDPGLIGTVRRAAGITRIADITRLDYIGVPVVSAIRPASLSLTVASGKGTSLGAAVLSAVFEAFEQQSAETPAVGTFTAPRDAAPGSPFVDLATLPRDSRCRAPDKPRIRWAPAVRLRDGAGVFVPYDMVHLDLTVATMAASDGFLVSTNGLAAATSRESAVLHGLCEVIERDAIAIASPPGGPVALDMAAPLDLDAVADRHCAAIVGRCRVAGVLAEAWDLTSDLGIPVVYARVSETREAPHRLAPPTDGSGCDPCPAVALRRALTEALQSRLTLISGVRDDILRHYYGDLGRQPRGGAGPERRERRSLDELPCLPGRTPAERLDAVLDSLCRAGLTEACCVDLGTADEAIAVRVIVPGLEGMTLSRGYIPGRRASERWRRR